MIDILKLILITMFLFLSSKAIGDFIESKKWLPFNSGIGIGYLSNFALFFIVTFPVPLLKLSTLWLMVLGGIFTIIDLVFIIISFRRKTLLHFSKVDYAAFILTIIMMLVYLFCLDFGGIETYDSYFYSSLTNSAANVDHISVIDPYSGLSNLQNFYKYMSYYYLASFFGAGTGLPSASLVLYWPLTFMNFFLIFITSLTVCRISKNFKTNNILSLFYLTFMLSIFRAPFNALYLVTFVASIYCFRLAFQMFKGRPQSIVCLLICIIASISFTSTSLFTLLPFVFILVLTNGLVKEPIPYRNLFILALPEIALGGLYMYESLKTPTVLVILGVFCAVIYLLFHYSWFSKIVKYASFVIAAGLIIVFLFPKQLHVTEFIGTAFTQSTGISESEQYEERKLTYCIENDNEIIPDQDVHHDYVSKMGSSVRYMATKSDSLISKILVLLTHSIPKYGGMVFLLIFGFLYRRKSYAFISYIFYLILFNNPLVIQGVDIVMMGLSSRIILFFNTYYALLGIKYFFEFMSEKSEKWKKEKMFEKSISFIAGGLGICVVLSIGLFCVDLKPQSYKDYNFLYKMPQSVVETEEAMNRLHYQNPDQTKKARFFFTESTFNVTMIDRSGKDKVIIMNSKEYMQYFFNHNEVTHRTMINDYFESDGKYNFNTYPQLCAANRKDKGTCEQRCGIQNLLDIADADYIVTKRLNQDFVKELKQKNIQVLWSGENSMILHRNQTGE